MKRYTVLIFLVLASLSISAAFAQDNPNQTVTLNDATPGIDIVVSTLPETTGAITLQLSGASVTVTDSIGNIVFQVADPRIHGLELHFAPDSQTHTVTVERLPGVNEAYITATSQLDMTSIAGTQLITTGPVTTGQELDTPLTASMPGLTLPLSILTSSPTGTVIASFPGAPVTAQVVDSNGVSLANLSAGQIDGLSMTLDSGDYGLTLLNTDTAIHTVAAVGIIPAVESFLPEAVMTDVAPALTPAVVAAPSMSDCTIQISQSSINLRSGPGTGYSILNYSFRGDVLVVGGTNPESSWLLVGSSQGSAWMDETLGNLSGTCDNLPVYNIPYREASAPSIIVQPAAGGSGSPAFGGQHEEHEDHEDDDSGGHENDDSDEHENDD